MIDTRPAQIIETLYGMLTGILVDDGYLTNVGRNVYTLRYDFDVEVDKFPLLALNYHIKTSSSAEVDHSEAMAVDITALALRNADTTDQLAAVDLIERLDRDIKTAVKLDDLPYWAQPVRPTGSGRTLPGDNRLLLRAAVGYTIHFEDQYGFPAS